MPNVMGREFPYTAEGMAAAQQYSQAMGMRDGGMMGFRPVGYDNGGTVDVVAELRQRFYELRDLVAAGASGAESELIDLINREQEGLRASNDPKMNEIINNYLPPTQPEDVGNLGRMGSDFEREPGLDEMIRQLDVDRKLYNDPAYMMAEDERAAGKPPAAILKDAQDQLEVLKRRGAAQGFLPNVEGFVDPDMENLGPMPYYNPDQLNPFFNPNEIEVADGGYITRKMNRGGIMSLRGY